MNHLHYRKAFTIVELMIVLVVVAILAAIVYVSYTAVQTRARETELETNLRDVASQLQVSFSNNGTFPNDLTGVKKSGTIAFNYTRVGNGYCLTAVQATGTSKKFYIINGSTAVIQGECPIQEGSFMQVVTTANCPTTTTMAVDARDSHTYWVQKLGDGKCWMLTNLAYAGGGTTTYSDTVSLTNGTGGSSTYTTPSYYVVPSTTNYTTTPTSPSTSVDGTGQYGYLYNFCGANGGQAGNSACSSSSSTAVNASVSVCPAGWRLPTNTGSGGDFTNLNTAVNDGLTTTHAGLLSEWYGQRGGSWSAGFSNQGNHGNYWASTAEGTTSARYLYFTSLSTTPGIIPGNVGNKMTGYAIRCVTV